MNLDAFEAEAKYRVQSNGNLIKDQLLDSETHKKKIEVRSNKLFRFYKPYPIFQEFHNLGAEPKVRVRFLMAANRIGKSISCFAETAMHATLTYPDWWNGYRYTSKDMVIWVGGRSHKDLLRLRRGLFKDQKGFPPFIHPSLVVYSNYSNNEFHIKNALGGTTLLELKTCDGGVEKKSGQSGWTGENVSFIWIDEPPPMSVLNEANTRITQTSAGDKSMMVVSSTCVELSEFFLYVTEKVEQVEVNVDGVLVLQHKQDKIAPQEIYEGRVYITASLDDAPHLSEEEKKRMIASWPVHERQARSTGIPIIGSGLVFPVLEEAITYEPCAFPDSFGHIGGMDFGEGSDLDVLLLGAWDFDNEKLYVYFEYAARQKKPADIIFELLQIKKAEAFKWCTIVADTSGNKKSVETGNSLRDLYEKSPIHSVTMVNAEKKDKFARVQEVLQMFSNGTLVISYECRGLLNEIRTYSYKNNKLQDGNDHHIDALLYMVGGLKKNYAKPKIYKTSLRPKSKDGGLSECY